MERSVRHRHQAGPSWLLARVVTLTVAVGVAAARVARCQSAVAGLLAIGNEYSPGMIKLSLTAVPRRLTWLFAKATVLTALVHSS